MPAGDRAVIYCRVSGKKQEDNFSLPFQVERCTAHCGANEYNVVCTLKEVHTGAELDERPEMTKLRDMMKRHEFDVLVMVVLDRLARNQNHTEVVLYYAERAGVRVELTEERYEDTPIGRHMRAVAAFAAELERDKIRTRTTNGRNQRVRQGSMIPGRVPLYGYKWADEKKTRYILHPFTAKIVERIFMEAAMGRPIRRIAVELTRDGILTPGDQHRQECSNPDDPPRGDAWAKSTVWNILKHPAYYGQHSAFRWEYLKRREVDTLSGENVVVNTTREREIGDKRVILADAAPPIISPEIAEAVAARLASNQAASQRNNRHPEVALLRGGFAKCGLCEGNMIVSFIGKKGQQVPTYRCGHSHYSATGANTCRGVTMSVSKLDKAVWDKVIGVLKDPEVLEREARSRIASGGNADAIEALKRRVKRLELQQLNARKALLQIQDEGMGMEEFRAGLIDDAPKAAQAKVETQEEIQQLERQQHQWERVQERLKHARVWCDAVTHAEGTLSYEERRIVLYGLGTLVTVYPAGSRPRARLKVGDQTIELEGRNGVEQPILIGEIVPQSYCPPASRGP